MSSRISAGRRATKLAASIVTALALVLGACGGGQQDDGASQTTPVAPTAVPALDSTTEENKPAPSTDATTSAAAAGDSERPSPNPDRQLAPDFTLNLGSGSTFVMSEETRPVFMVFWAEW